MAKYEELEKDPVVQDWLKLRTNANTRKSYLMGLQKYLDFTGMTPDELLNEAEDEISGNVKPRNYQHTKRVKAFLVSLDCADTSKRNILNAVKCFYDFADVTLPKNIKVEKVETLDENSIHIERDDIAKALTVADPLERAVMLVGLSAGLAQADIFNLKMSDFKTGYDPETGITTLKLVRVKTGVKFVTFLTPEASEAVLDYLAFRNRSPTLSESRTSQYRKDQLSKQKVYSDIGYLFIMRHIDDEFLETRNENLRMFEERTFTKMYERLAEKCGKVNPEGYNIVRSHNMRKFFVTTLRNEGFDFKFVDQMAGHKEDAVDRAYYNYKDADKLRERYKKCIPYLTIEKHLDITTSPAYKKLIEENEAMKLEIGTIRELKTKVEKLETGIKDIIDSYWESEAEHRDEKETEEHFNEVEKEDLKKEIDELRGLVSMMLKGQGFDIDKPLSKELQKAAKNAPDW
jgi:integrase